MQMTRKLMMAVLALAWAINVTAAADMPQNVAREGMSLRPRSEQDREDRHVHDVGEVKTFHPTRPCRDVVY